MDIKKVTINGNSFCDLNGFYNEINNVLTKDLDWATGHNLNAFNDLLRGGFGVHEYEEEIIIEWINSEKSKQDLGYEGTINYYESILPTCHPSSQHSIEDYLNQAKMNQGDTLFEVIIGIIKEHPEIQLILN